MTKKYTKSLKCSLLLSLISSTMMSFNMCMLTGIHVFIKCFIFVNNNSQNTSELNYKTYCHNDTNLKSILRVTNNKNNSQENSQENTTTNIVWSWGLLSSMILLIVPLTSLLCISLNNHFGRKRTLQFSIIMNIIGLITMIFGFNQNFYNFFLLGRFLSGVTIGINITCTPLYLQEIALPDQRRKFGSYFFIFLNVGIVLISVLELEQIFGTAGEWIYVCYLGIGLQVFAFVVSLFSVDTPDYFISLGREDEAKIVMGKLHGLDNLELLLKSKAQPPGAPKDQVKANSTPESLSTLFKNKNKSLTKLTIMLLFLRKSIELASSYSALVFFSGDIFSSLGYTNNQVIYLIIFSRVLAVVAASLLSFIIERNKKKKLLMVICGLIVVCHGMMVLLDVTEMDQIYLIDQLPNFKKYATTIILNLLLCLCFLGPLPIPTIITTMMIRPQHRTIVNSFIEFFGWIITFIATFVFPILYQILGNTFFGCFGVLMVLNIIWMKFRFIGPEGKDYGELERMVGRRRFYL